MAMGGYGTTHFSAGSSTLYGEVDILEWLVILDVSLSFDHFQHYCSHVYCNTNFILFFRSSGMTEKDVPSTTFFNRQGILGRERVPVLFTSFPNDIYKETGEKGWVANLDPYTDDIPVTTSEEQAATLPWAARYINCDDEIKNLCGAASPFKWDGVCWVPRSDVDPDKLGIRLARAPGGQASWHPGWRSHQLDSRKKAVFVLNALKKAFDVWEEGVKKDGFPLNEKYWHVGSIYKEVQESLKNNIGEGKEGECEEKFEKFGVKKLCYLPMSGMSQFTPVNIGQENSLLKHVTKGANGHPREVSHHHIYKGPNLWPVAWKIPSGDVDVHAIAIATNYEAPQIDHFWEDVGDDDDVEEDAESGRRLDQAVKNEERVLSSTGIVPGEGWGLTSNTQTPEDFCDGSPMSECQRSVKVSCPLYANNDHHGSISGDGNSGWLVINVPNVKNGYIVAKMEVSAQ